MDYRIMFKPSVVHQFHLTVEKLICSCCFSADFRDLSMHATRRSEARTAGEKLEQFFMQAPVMKELMRIVSLTYGHTGIWTQGLPHAKRMWYHYTMCPLTLPKPFPLYTKSKRNLLMRYANRDEKWAASCRCTCASRQHWWMQNGVQVVGCQTWNRNGEFYMPERKKIAPPKDTTIYVFFIICLQSSRGQTVP